MKFFSVILLLITLNLTNSNSKDSNILSQYTEKGLTLKEAISIAQQEALKWNKEALLYNGLSVDSDEIPTGMDGRRKNWNIEFGIPGKTDFYLLMIRDGKVWRKLHLSNELKRMTESYFISNLEVFMYDSPELLKKSKKITKIYPGETFAKGYNFGFTKNPVKDIPLAMVIGWDANKRNMIYLQYNAKTGELVNKFEREQYKN
jgi:hypothetical protein